MSENTPQKELLIPALSELKGEAQARGNNLRVQVIKCIISLLGTFPNSFVFDKNTFPFTYMFIEHIKNNYTQTNLDNIDRNLDGILDEMSNAVDKLHKDIFEKWNESNSYNIARNRKRFTCGMVIIVIFIVSTILALLDTFNVFNVGGKIVAICSIIDFLDGGIGLAMVIFDSKRSKAACEADDRIISDNITIIKRKYRNNVSGGDNSKNVGGDNYGNINN